MSDGPDAAVLLSGWGVAAGAGEELLLATAVSEPGAEAGRGRAGLFAGGLAATWRVVSRPLDVVSRRATEAAVSRVVVSAAALAVVSLVTSA